MKLTLCDKCLARLDASDLYNFYEIKVSGSGIMPVTLHFCPECYLASIEPLIGEISNRNQEEY